MEVVGVVASVATLVAVAKEVSELTIKLTNSLCDAPRQLAQVQNHTCLVFLALQSLDDICVNAGLHDLLSEEEIWTFNQALTIAKHEIMTVNRYCNKICVDGSASRRRLRWSLMQKGKAEECLQQLQRVENSLAIILQSTNLKINLRTSISLRDSLKPTASNTMYTRSQPDHTSRPKSQQRSLSLKHEDMKNRKAIFGAFELNAFWASLLNCDFVVTHHTERSQKTYQCQAKISLPTFSGHMALFVMVSLRQSRLKWQEFDILGGRLRFVSYANDQVVSACLNGDLMTVRDMILVGNAAPTDVSREGNSLLWYAAKSGSIELVKYLIENGAAVLPNLLLFAAHWQRPDLARLCFSNGVDADFIGRDGMTAPMFLYSPGRRPDVQTEFLDIITCNSFTEMNRQDPRGWTVLHRAAAFGTREDVKALLAAKVATSVETHTLAWNALFCAVCHNNFETMEELWNVYDNPHQLVDLRKWNLLHVAAGAGNFEAVAFLIQHGVDLDASSNAMSCAVPPSLKDRRLTPSEVARLYGEESYRIWCNTLQSCGRVADPPFDDVDWGDTKEELHVGYGGCECCNTWEF